MFFVELPKLADLTTRHSLENVLVIRSVLHQLVNFLHRAFAVPLGQPLQKIGGDVIARVPATPTGTPMWGLETGTEADPIWGGVSQTSFAKFENEDAHLLCPR